MNSGLNKRYFKESFLLPNQELADRFSTEQPYADDVYIYVFFWAKAHYIVPLILSKKI